MSGCCELMRRKLIEEIYDGLSDEDKKLFVQMTLQNKRYTEIAQTLQRQDKKLDDIQRSQSWWRDFSSNIAGNALWEGATWLFTKVFRRL